nr:uncharacterized protein LOC119163775 [Rhipicephalus microplus]
MSWCHLMLMGAMVSVLGCTLLIAARNVKRSQRTACERLSRVHQPASPSFVGSLSSASPERYHSLVSVQGRLHSCRQCTFVTKYSANMNRHIRTHTVHPSHGISDSWSTWPVVMKPTGRNKFLVLGIVHLHEVARGKHGKTPSLPLGPEPLPVPPVLTALAQSSYEAHSHSHRRACFFLCQLQSILDALQS